MGDFFSYEGPGIHYTDRGRGKPVMLVHGYLETLQIWNDFATVLSEKFRVLCIDIPGHGRSEIYNEVHTMEFIAEKIMQLLDHLNIDKIFLTGHSLGGYITLAFAELFPHKLSGYCLFHSHPFADTPEVAEKRKREINLAVSGRMDLVYPENVARMFATDNLEKFQEKLKMSEEIAASISGEGVAAILKGMMVRPDRHSVMESGKAPLLWILGARDNYINCTAIQSRVKLPANAMTYVLENSGHMGFTEQIDESLKIVTGFIERC